MSLLHTWAIAYNNYFKSIMQYISIYVNETVWVPQAAMYVSVHNLNWKLSRAVAYLHYKMFFNKKNFFSVYCKPTDSSLDGYVYDDFQNDNNNYGGDYDDVDEESEQGNVPDVPLSITTAREDFIRNLSETVILPCAITGRSE